MLTTSMRYGTAAALLASGLAVGTAGAQQQVKLSYHWGPNHPAASFADAFAERLTERSDGALQVDVFPSGQLFGIREVLGGVSSGAVQIGMAVGVASFPPLTSDYDITAVPGLFDSFEEMRGFFAETEAGQAIVEEIETSARIRIVGYNPVGPIAIFSTIEDLSTVGSLSGASARVLTDADRVRWEALEAERMVSLPTGEVYTALQSGMIDTVATVPGALAAYSWWDFIKSAQLPYFQFGDGYIIANGAWFDNLSPELQALVREVGAEISAESTAAINAASAQVLDGLEQKGGTVYTLEGEELERLRRLEREEVYPRLADRVSQDVLDAALAYTGAE